VTSTEALQYVKQLDCKGGSCEAEVVGDPPRWLAHHCWRHERAEEIAERWAEWKGRRSCPPLAHPSKPR